MSNPILVIGGTGTTGSSLIQMLKANDTAFTAMVRSPEKQRALEAAGISTVVATLGEWDRVDQALQGVDTVFLLTSPGPQSVPEQNGLIDRAKAAGVRKIVKVSAVGAQIGSKVQLADWHGQIESHLKESGLEYIILRPHSFMQNTLMSIPTIKSDQTIYQSLGASKIPLVDTRDIARAAFTCLTTDRFNNKTFEITGPEAVGYEDVASALSKSTKQAIKYQAIPPEAHNQAMKQAHVPDWLADDLTLMSKGWGSKPVHQPSPDLQSLTGNRGHTIQDFARDYADYFRA